MKNFKKIALGFGKAACEICVYSFVSTFAFADVSHAICRVAELNPAPLKVYAFCGVYIGASAYVFKKLIQWYASL
jgi:hypothetical protein